MHYRYRLELEEQNPDSVGERWQVAFHQLDNNRYLLELSKLRGDRFYRFDTVASQRAGTSFALSDAGNGPRECIISGGLGTQQVTYQGRSYWVCCSGCKAAFEEDPETWLAEYRRRKSNEQ